MAAAAAAGMDSLVLRYYSTADPSEVALLRDVIQRGIEIAGDIRQDLANRTIKELADSMKRKKSRHQHAG